MDIPAASPAENPREEVHLREVALYLYRRAAAGRVGLGQQAKRFFIEGMPAKGLAYGHPSHGEFDG